MHISYSNRGDVREEKRREVGRVLVVDRTLANGFHDLLVKETVTDSAGKKGTSGRCRVEPARVKTNGYRLQYDGSKYTVPRDMTEVDCGVCSRPKLPLATDGLRVPDGADSAAARRCCPSPPRSMWRPSSWGRIDPWAAGRSSFPSLPRLGG